VSSAIQRTARQSPYKMRLVIDQIRGKDVNEALGLLKFSKKHAAVQIAKVLNSAVANAEFKSREANESIDVDTLYVAHAIVNEGPALRRFMPAALRAPHAVPRDQRKRLQARRKRLQAPRGVNVNGTENTSDRLPPRHLQDLEIAVVREP
jgi:large subunit ribosomal protein L22